MSADVFAALLCGGAARADEPARRPQKKFRNLKRSVEASIQDGQRVVAFLIESYGQGRPDSLLQRIARGAKGSQPSAAEPPAPACVIVPSESGTEAEEESNYRNDCILEKTFIYGVVALSKWLGRDRLPHGVSGLWPPALPADLLPRRSASQAIDVDASAPSHAASPSAVPADSLSARGAGMAVGFGPLAHSQVAPDAAP